MVKKIIRLSKSCLSSKEKKWVKKVLDKEFLGLGPEVKKFENELSKFFKRSTICFNSGTAALQVALQAIGIKPDDEVIFKHNICSNISSNISTGAKPVMCDIDTENLKI